MAAIAAWAKFLPTLAVQQNSGMCNRFWEVFTIFGYKEISWRLILCVMRAHLDAWHSYKEVQAMPTHTHTALYRITP